MKVVSVIFFFHHGLLESEVYCFQLTVLLEMVGASYCMDSTHRTFRGLPVSRWRPQEEHNLTWIVTVDCSVISIAWVLSAHLGASTTNEPNKALREILYPPPILLDSCPRCFHIGEFSTWHMRVVAPLSNRLRHLDPWTVSLQQWPSLGSSWQGWGFMVFGRTVRIV